MSKINRLLISFAILFVGAILLPKTVLPLEPFNWPALQPYNEPEMAVIGNGQVIAAGDTTPTTVDDTDFGSILVFSEQITHTFTISNSGAVDLTLTGSPRASLSGSASGNFNVTRQPSSPIAAGNTSTFDITFAPTTSGILTAMVTIDNNDTDENPYTFVISGNNFTIFLPIILK